MTLKKILTVMLVAATFLMVVGCGNQQLFDSTYTFDRAIIELPNGEIVDGKVTSWNDYDGEQLQIKIGDTTYLTHSENVVLISE